MSVDPSGSQWAVRTTQGLWDESGSVVAGVDLTSARRSPITASAGTPHVSSLFEAEEENVHFEDLVGSSRSRGYTEVPVSGDGEPEYLRR